MYNLFYNDNIFIISVFTLFFEADIGNPDVCPSGSWPYEDKTCFNAVDNGLTWPTARDTCASGTPYGQLAKIPDQATQDFLEGKLQGRTNFYWIGAFEGLKWYWERCKPTT